MASLKVYFKRLLRPIPGRHEPDPFLIASIFGILAFGLIALSSASAVVAYDTFGDAYFFFKKQLFGIVVGLIAFWFFSRIDYRIWSRSSYAFGFLVFSIFLLLLVFVPGLRAEYGSAQSWINIFGHSLQPSEFVKLSFLLYLSAWLEIRGKNIGDFHEGTGPFMVVLGIISILMLLQPDIGTLSIIGLVSLVVFFVGGGSLRHILIIGMVGLVAFSVMVQFKSYQLDRFRCLFDYEVHKQDICYQVNQSLIAVGSGGFWGRGLGESRQKYMYLPEVSGDSIFAVIAEELGLVFSSILILAYFLLFYRGYLVSKYAPDDFGRILSIGIVSWIGFQAIINIGGIINILPMTGVPLPLISYGGSAIAALMAAAGILVSISTFSKKRK